MHRLFLTLALVCAPTMSAAAEFFTPVGITSPNSSAYYPIERLYQGPGLGFAATPPHDSLAGNEQTWVTQNPNGPGNYYANGVPAPILIIDLGTERNLSEISTWGYADGNANGVRTFDLRFATAAEGPAGFGASIPGQGGFTANASAVSRHSHPLLPVTARYVEFTATANWRGYGNPGGDRVGLGEISFEDHTDPKLAVAAALDFGIRPPDAGPLALPLALANQGQALTLTFTSATLSGPDAACFAVSSLPASLPPQASDSVNITFDPGDRLGVFSAWLTLATNDAANPLQVVNLSARVALVTPGSGPFINEFMAANSNSLQDGDGNRPDWIEIHNPGAETVDLTGWYLTDRADNLTKWTFPASIIPADGYLIVFASGQASSTYIDAGGYPHTNFNLSAAGEYLGLVMPDARTIVSEYHPAFPAQFDNLSYGYSTAYSIQESDLIGYLASPTPGAANSESLLPGPAISEVSPSPAQPLAGSDTVITARVTARLDPVAAVILHYRKDFETENAVTMTDDGTGVDLSAGDGVFSAAIPAAAHAAGYMLRWYVSAVDNSANVGRAPAFLARTGDDQSPEYYGTLIPDPAIVSALPVFHWFTQNPAAAHASAGTRACVSFAGRFYDNVFVRRRGGATNGSVSQKFDFNKGAKLYIDDSMPAVDEINLNGNGSDSTYVRQPLAFETYRYAGHAACQSALWQMRVNGASDRVGVFIEQVDESFLSRNGYDPEGELYKITGYQLAPSLSTDLGGFEKKTGNKADSSSFSSLIAGLNQATADERRRYLIDQLDLPQILNYLALRSITQDADDVRKNYYIYQDARGDQRWRIFPWDKDWTFGITGDGGTWLPHPFFADEEHAKQNANQWNVLYDVMFEETTTQRLYLRRLRTLMDSVLQPAETPPEQRLLEARAAAIIAPASPPLGSSVASINNYLASRRSVLFNNYPDLIPGPQPTAPSIAISGAEFNPAGSQDREYIIVTNSEATEIDISGWSLDGGIRFTFAAGTVIERGGVLHVSPDTLAFRQRPTAPTGNQENIVVGPYSGHLSNFGETITLLDPAGIVVSTHTTPYDPSPAQRYLVISEIMYHPEPDGDAEFIELLNTSATETLDLAGLRFSSGIAFTFPAGATLAPGARTVVVKNTASFTAVHGSAATIAGQFDSPTSLSNGGETLHLNDADGSTICEFAYDDAAPWPTAADGNASLVLIAPLTRPDPALPQSWRASMTPTGNPGTSDALVFSGDANADDDGDGLPNLVEYTFGPDTPPVVTATADGLVLTVPHLPNADDATASAEFSIDLETWLPAEDLGVSVATHRFRTPPSHAAVPRLFMRAVATLLPQNQGRPRGE